MKVQFNTNLEYAFALIITLNSSIAFGTLSNALGPEGDPDTDQVAAFFDGLLEGKPLSDGSSKKRNPKTEFLLVKTDRHNALVIDSPEKLAKIESEIEGQNLKLLKSKKYLFLHLHPDIAEKINQRKRERGILRRFAHFLTRSALRLSSSVASFSVVFSVVSPYILAPMYSKWSGYSYNPIPFNMPNPSFHRFDAPDLSHYDALETSMLQVQESIEALGPNIESSLRHTLDYNVNYFKGRFAPPNTMARAAFIGAGIGLYYHCHIEGLLGLPVSIASGLVDLPNQIAKLLFNKFMVKKLNHKESKQFQENTDRFDQEEL